MSNQYKSTPQIKQKRNLGRKSLKWNKQIDDCRQVGDI